MRRNQFSRFALSAAAIGALVYAAFAVMPSRAAEDAVKIPPPAADAQGSDGIQTAVLSGRLLLGRAGRVPAYRGRDQRGLRLCGR